MTRFGEHDLESTDEPHPHIDRKVEKVIKHPKWMEFSGPNNDIALLKVAFFIMLWAEILNFKFRIVFWNVFFFGDWEIWKTNHTYWKKPHLKLNRWNESFYYVLLFTCDEVASTKSVPCKEIEPEILIYNNVVLAFHDACLLLPLASYKLWLYCRVSLIWKILEFSKSMILFLKFWLNIFGKLVSDLL